VAAVSERSLAPRISVVDIHDNIVWSRFGHLSLVYRIDAFHEPGLDGADFNSAALLAENCWTGLPEGTFYQFYVFVDQRRGVRRLVQALPPIAGESPKDRLFEEFRKARLRELTREEEGGTAANLVQDRRHYLCATFTPVLPRPSALRRACDDVMGRFTTWLGGAGSRRSGGRWMTTYDTLVEQSRRFARRVEVGLSQMGLGFERCSTPEIVRLAYELLNPTASGTVDVDSLSERARSERDGLPRSIVEQIPYAGDTSPVWSLLNDDLLIRRDHLRLGDRFVSVISLKELPDRTEPGILVPLLALNRERYLVYYRVDIPRAGVELAALRAKATLAAGLKLENFIVKSDRTDPQANAVEKQSDAAMERIISSAQRIFGTTLQLVLYEGSAAALEEGIQETLGALSRAHGLRGYRETYLLLEAYLSLVPGAPPLVERRRKTLTPVMVDMLPMWGFQSGEGKVPFLTPTNGLVLYDPFDTGAQPNANILVTGTSGAGKSFAVSYLLSGYEVACAGRQERAPFTFILDNGASYRRYIELRPDGRYVAYSFEQPPGVQPFVWHDGSEDLDEHVSRLEWLLLDLLHVSEADPERFERKKAAIEAALYKVYREGVDRDFKGFAQVLGAIPDGKDLVTALFPFTEGKFAKLFEERPGTSPAEGVHAVCYDFLHLAEHRDFAALALRLCVYEIRRFAARMARRHYRTFLVIDESWALLEGTGGGGVASIAGPFLASSVRMGRKEGMSVIGLSQVIEDFVRSPYGAAIVGNSSTKLIGQPGGESVEGLRVHLRLTDRQVEQVRRLSRTPRYHEFLLIQGDRNNVVRVPADPFSKWVFTTSPKDRERLARVAEERPDLSLLEMVRSLAAEG
jgi:type IV secretory pathway VirB4 component